MSEKILIDSPGVVELVNKSLWASNKGNHYNEEQDARWDSCTHNYCDCGAEKEKKYSYCSKCRRVRRVARYEKHPKVDWDETGLLNSYDDDKFFGCWLEVVDYCVEISCHPKALMLMVSEPALFEEIEPGNHFDEMCSEEELPIGITTAFEELNAYIKDFNTNNSPRFFRVGYKMAANIPQNVVDQVKSYLRQAGINV